MKKTHIGITGSSGFIGSHVIERLKRVAEIEVIPDQEILFQDLSRLKEFINRCDVIVHLAAMNRGDADETNDHFPAVPNSMDKLRFCSIFEKIAFVCVGRILTSKTSSNI